MLQVARLAPKLLGESRELVEAFILSQLDTGGGFRNRAGQSDLYYTVFGLESLIALRSTLPQSHVAAYLAGFGGGEGLDFVHLACLARAWAALPGEKRSAPSAEILSRIERYRTPDGGYNQQAGASHGSVYAAFLALGAYQDLQTELPNRSLLLHSLDALRSGDGGFANHPGADCGVTTATAAAVTLYRQLGVAPGPDLGRWLLDRRLPSGGFVATASAPVPDLLSTATALHALSGLHAPIEEIREPCLDFVDSLWTNRGGFYGHWMDDQLDCEYTYYGLLALGHLA
jgi:prenyltransferase beta subunit